MPIQRVSCRICGAEHSTAPRGRPAPPGGTADCPYEGLAYGALRAAHDGLYFGRWRSANATRIDIRQARHRLERLLSAIAEALRTADVPAAKRDLDKALDAMYSLGADEEGPRDLLLMDHALSYAHRVIGDLLHEKGLPPHAPADFAAWHDAVDVPFRDEW